MAAGALVLAASAQATTGNAPLAHPPVYKVTRKQGAPYVGSFKLVRPHAVKVSKAAYVARYNEFGFLEGSLVVYSYDSAGTLTSWVARTYEYHVVGGRMEIDLIAPVNQLIIGHLVLHKNAKRELVGQLTGEVAAGQAQQITFASVR